MTDAAQEKPSPDAAPRRLVLVTGMSGAGKTMALKALEDMGYEAVDNLPLALLPDLVHSAASGKRPIAIGVDIRTRDFGTPSFLAEIDRLVAEYGGAASLVFLDCDDEALRRRYTETRRRHPLAGDRPLMDGIRHERQLVARLSERADHVIDTTDFQLADLLRVFQGLFALDAAPGLTLFVTSFSFRRGLPREADLVFDVRFLANPHYDPALRRLSGRDEAVAAFVTADPGYAPFFDTLTTMMGALLPRYTHEGKSYLTIAFGCTGGQHRSVTVAEALAVWLRARGERVDIVHRDMVEAAP